MSYSPSIYPERRESFVGNIVRAVASINLETLETAYHNVRYKLDYHLIHARLKYYSNSKNPRVIQTKLNNQRLLTLRTNPQDPYFVKPGEFLTLGSADRNYNSDTLDGVLHYYYHPGSLDIESCPPALCESDRKEEAEIVPAAFATRSKNAGPKPLAGNPYKGGFSRHISDAERKKTKMAFTKKWDDETAVSSDTATALGKKKMRRILTKKSYVPVIEEEEAGALLDSPLESLLPRYLQSSYSSPVTFAEEEAHGQRKNKHEYQKSATSGNNSGSLLEQDSSYANYANYSNLLQVISPVESVSMFRQNSPRFMRSPGGNRESRPDDRKVWQLVLSDISLSAARLSTGSEGTSRDEFEDLKGDLTHAKVKEHPDFFAENMRQAKAKFYGHATEEGGDTKRNS